MKFPLSIVVTLISAASVINAVALPSADVEAVNGKSNSASGVCHSGSYECAPGGRQIWVCKGTGYWTVAATCADGWHCSTVNGNPFCTP
ncbi:uncharacterized protein PAC_14341 [Phialocephala subalpina]|uniref:Uncharacterized protein n=1 Tax=Phialocephala subalpina TaxID=576137 RepID=A0A1L7XHB6_9HELO|nr:uncharacterized protein PAC_14341 [Phialocephala subalpina]